MNQATNKAAPKKDKTTNIHFHGSELPRHGKSRWRQAAPFIPCSREKFRLLGAEGKAPQPERLGIRCTFYDNHEIHRWLVDPASYRAPNFKKAA